MEGQWFLATKPARRARPTRHARPRQTDGVLLMRPNMNEVVLRFEEIVQGLSQWKLRSRAAPRFLYLAQKIQTPLHFASHCWRKITYILKKTPAIPMIP